MEKLFTSYQHQSQHFDPALTGQYVLSLSTGREGAQYAILDEKGKILALKDYRARTPMEPQDILEAALAADPFLRAKYSRALFTAALPDFTLVPAPFFTETRAREFLRAMSGDSVNTGHVETVRTGLDDAMLVYLVPLPLRQKLDFHFPGMEHRHICQPLISFASSLSSDNGNFILLHVMDRQCVVVGFHKKKLHLCNVYPFRAPADIIYFTQLAAELIKSGESAFDIALTGDFEKDSELLHQIGKYIPRFQLPVVQLKPLFDMQGEQLPVWRYGWLAL